MRLQHLIRSTLIAVVGGAVSSTWAANVLFMVSSATTPINADPGIKARLESQGHTVTLFTAGGDQATQLAAANANDMVIISESIASSAVLTGADFNLQSYAKPVISFEAFMWDNAHWTGPVQNQDFGVTGRPGELGATHPNLVNLSDTLRITNSAHPLAAGLANGPAVVYTQPYTFNIGIVGGGATVIATADSVLDPAPVHFVYESGATLANGSITPGMRIGLFLGQNAAGNAADPGPPTIGFLNSNGLALLDAAVRYASPIPEPGSIALFSLGIVILRTRRVCIDSRER